MAGSAPNVVHDDDNNDGGDGGNDKDDVETNVQFDNVDGRAFVRPRNGTYNHVTAGTSAAAAAAATPVPAPSATASAAAASAAAVHRRRRPDPPPLVPPPLHSLSAEAEAALKCALATVVLIRRAKERAAGRRADDPGSHVTFSGLCLGGEGGGGKIADDKEHGMGRRGAGQDGEVKDDDEDNGGGGGVQEDDEEDDDGRISERSRQDRRRNRLDGKPFVGRGSGTKRRRDYAEADGSGGGSNGRKNADEGSSSRLGALLPPPKTSYRSATYDTAAEVVDGFHLRSMIRVAVSTAMALYDDGRYGNDGEDGSGGSKSSRPPVYDYDACSLPPNVLQERSGRLMGGRGLGSWRGTGTERGSAIASTYATLDGLASHLSHQFLLVLRCGGPSFLVDLIRADILREMMINGHGDDHDYCDYNNAHNKDSDDKNYYLGKDNDERDEIRNKDKDSERPAWPIGARRVMATCALLHRIAYLDRSDGRSVSAFEVRPGHKYDVGGGRGRGRVGFGDGLAMAVIRAACGTLRDVYHGGGIGDNNDNANDNGANDVEEKYKVDDSGGGGDEGGKGLGGGGGVKKGMGKGTQHYLLADPLERKERGDLGVDAGGSSKNSSTTKIISARQNCDSDIADVLAVNLLYLIESVSSLLLIDRVGSSSSSSSVAAAAAARKGRVAETILSEFRFRLGDELVVPLPSREMASYYRAERAKRIDSMRKVGEIGGWSKKDAVPVRASTMTKLSPEGQMMLRLCLFDLAKRLCTYCDGS